MTETEEDIADCVTTWVWAGFYEPEEIREMMDDILESDCNVARLEAVLAEQVELKAAAESSWPAETDCDRLDRAFVHLHDEGICALSNAGYTMSDGRSEVAEAVAQAPEGKYDGYCFYHEQDVERAIKGQELMIAFGDMQHEETRDCAVGRRVVNALTCAGFRVVWDGSHKTRISIPDFDWKRRYS